MSKYKPGLTVADYKYAEDFQEGICINCGEYRSDCEPDAREYPCEECGKNTVYGVSEALRMDAIQIVGKK